MIRFWKGFHDRSLSTLLEEAWRNDDLVILSSPYVKDFSFAGFLPAGPFSFHGDWEPSAKAAVEKALNGSKRVTEYAGVPVAGLFTTGTLSRSPKLVLYSKENIEASLQGMRSVFKTERIEKIFCYPQPTHAFGLILGYYHAQLYGAELVTGTGRYSGAFHEKWKQHESPGLLTLGTPTHFEDLVDSVARSYFRPRGSYSSIAGGAPVSKNLWKKIKSELNVEAPSIGYGASETSLGVTHSVPGVEPFEDREIGLPLPSVRFSYQAGRGVECAGPTVCLAMIQDGKIEFPKSVFLSDDLDFRKADGVYLYRGRSELILNRGGFKFSLEQIEKFLESRFGSAMTCVALPDSRLGEELGIVTTRPATDAGAIFMTLKQEFGHAFNSRNFASVDALPVSDNSKIDRRRCAEIVAEVTRATLR